MLGFSYFQNPVLGMLFCDKQGRVEVKTEEDLREIAPSKLYEEHLYVLCRLVSTECYTLTIITKTTKFRRSRDSLLSQSRKAVEQWTQAFPFWKVKYYV